MSDNEDNILKQIICELSKKLECDESDAKNDITKGQALIRNMVDEALAGDSRMTSNLLKYIDKLPQFYSDKQKEMQYDMSLLNSYDWESMFAFFGKHKELIEKEIAQRKQENPDYWSFDWYDSTKAQPPWDNQP